MAVVKLTFLKCKVSVDKSMGDFTSHQCTFKGDHWHLYKMFPTYAPWTVGFHQNQIRKVPFANKSTLLNFEELGRVVAHLLYQLLYRPSTVMHALHHFCCQGMLNQWTARWRIQVAIVLFLQGMRCMIRSHNI